MDPERLLARQPWASLRDLIPGDGAQVGVGLDRLREYARMLLDWNRGVSNLISRHDEYRLVERHLAESLAPAREIAALGHKRIVDFGSGAGLPALPLCLAGVGENWILVEARRNKTLFLRKVKQDMKLDNVQVITGRLEMLLDEQPEALRCDAFTSRATMTMGPTLEMAGKIVEPGGRALLWKGSRYVAERAETRDSWTSFWSHERTMAISTGPNVVDLFIRNAGE